MPDGSRQEQGYVESMKNITLEELAQQRMNELTGALRKYLCNGISRKTNKVMETNWRREKTNEKRDRTESRYRLRGITSYRRKERRAL